VWVLERSHGAGSADVWLRVRTFGVQRRRGSGGAETGGAPGGGGGRCPYDSAAAPTAPLSDRVMTGPKGYHGLAIDSAGPVRHRRIGMLTRSSYDVTPHRSWPTSKLTDSVRRQRRSWQASAGCSASRKRPSATIDQTLGAAAANRPPRWPRIERQRRIAWTSKASESMLVAQVRMIPPGVRLEPGSTGLRGRVRERRAHGRDGGGLDGDPRATGLSLSRTHPMCRRTTASRSCVRQSLRR
jgi:hypothetical protein